MIVKIIRCWSLMGDFYLDTKKFVISSNPYHHPWHTPWFTIIKWNSRYHVSSYGSLFIVSIWLNSTQTLCLPKTLLNSIPNKPETMWCKVGPLNRQVSSEMFRTRLTRVHAKYWMDFISDTVSPAEQSGNQPLGPWSEGYTWILATIGKISALQPGKQQQKVCPSWRLPELTGLGTRNFIQLQTS